ncbi:MAG: mmgC 5 [Microbacteriaceae bacterium]|nr:mmgC 5 [Microbacteriaceae bacterium]
MAMTFEELEEFRSWIREGITKLAPLSKTKDLVAADKRTDSSLWDGLAELGVFGFAVSDEFGGGEVGPLAVSIFLEEAGRELLPAGYLATVTVAPFLIDALAGDAKGPLLEAIAEGSARYAFADSETGSARQPAAAVVAKPQGDAWTLSGSKFVVIDADVANSILVTVASTTGESLYLVEADAAGLDIDRRKNLDETRPISTVTFSSTPATLVGVVGGASDALGAARNLLKIALAAEAAGASERALEIAIDYAKVREQFGRPIGQFQAIKHQAADMFVAVQASNSIVYAAFESLERAGRIPEADALVTSITALENLVRVANMTTQMHGGMGVTWEAGIHFYVKRGKASQLMIGSPDVEIEKLAAELFDSGVDFPTIFEGARS